MKKYLLLTLLLVSFSVYAWQPDKNKPVTVITGYPTGSSNEMIFRKLAMVVTANTSVNFIVKPKPGADAIIAMNELYDSKPDGYTIAVPSIPTLFVTNDIAEQRNLKKYSWDSFPTPVVLGQTPIAVITSPKKSVTSFKQLVNLLKTTDRPINVGQAGGTIKIIYEYLMLASDGNKKMVQDIGYTAYPPIISAIIGDQLDFGLVSLSSAYHLAEDGQIRILAITEDLSREDSFPKTYNVLPTFRFSTGWMIAMPPATELEVQQWYSREFTRAIHDQEVQQWARDNLITTDINLTSDAAVKQLGERMRKKLSPVMKKLSQGEK